MNRALSTLPGGLLEITLTVFFRNFKQKKQFEWENTVKLDCLYGKIYVFKRKIPPPPNP